MHLFWTMALEVLFLIGLISRTLLAFPNADRQVQLTKESSPPTCGTKDCIARANTLEKDMDKSVSPCDDFYEFACGKFIQDAKIPGDQSEVSKFSIVGDLLDEQLHEILEHGIHDTDIRPFRMVKTFYEACMNSSRIEETGEDEVKALLRNFGGWPVLEGEAWNETNFAWDDTGFSHLKNGIQNDYFVGWGIDTDLHNTTKRIFQFQQADLALSKKYLSKGLEEEIVKAYYDFMVDVAVMLGVDRKRAEVELLDSLNFEIALSNISLPEEDFRDPVKLYNPLKFSELRIRYPNYDWMTFVNKLLEGFTKLEEDEIINIGVPEFLTNVIELIGKTPKRVQSNYAHWRVVETLLSTMGEKYLKRELEYQKHLTGQTEKPERWEDCVNAESNSPLSLAIDSLYVRRFFDGSTKKIATDIIDGIGSSFKNILGKVDWMDEKSKSEALGKLEYLVRHVGYPEELTQDSELERYYENLGPMTDSFFKNLIVLSRFTIEKSMSKLRQPFNKTDWREHSNVVQVNAYYDLSENSINIPAGILQEGFFGKDLPAYMNYGGIGFVIGHEITHGFDDEGRQFDKEGNLVDWWAEKTKERYLEKVQCIIDQYSNYTVKGVGLNINGINTAGENIADNSGIKAAYYAYDEYLKSHGIEPPLSGFANYTPKQFFWLSAASVWCSAARTESVKSQVITDVHPPDKYRIIGTFSNMEEFAKDFNCPVGSQMNPGNKCTVW